MLKVSFFLLKCVANKMRFCPGKTRSEALKIKKEPYRGIMEMSRQTYRGAVPGKRYLRYAVVRRELNVRTAQLVPAHHRKPCSRFPEPALCVGRGKNKTLGAAFQARHWRV
jgi:hypothetical protein